MKDVFAEAADPAMTRATDSAHSPAAVPSDAAVSIDGHVCPFCGLTREITDTFDPATPCPRCTLADTPQTRSATKARIGPWHVRQVRNPWAPGMGFETLLALVKRGQVTKDSIVRGPTTHQLWKRAAEIKGLSREFGLCYSCGGEVGTQANVCRNCNRLQEPPANPDVLVEGREMVAPAPVAAPPAPVRAPVAASGTVSAVPMMAPPAKPQAEEVEELQDEPPQIEIGSSAPLMSADDMLGADEAALARQITSRPPVTPVRPPNTPPRPARPMRPRLPGGVDDALLTPQELAQAFQLGFTAPAGTAKKKSKLLVASVIVLLLGGGTAALLSLMPEMRTATTGWISDQWSAASGWLTSRTTLRPPMKPRVDLPVTNEVPATQPQREPLTIAPPPAPTPKSVEVVDPPQLSKPAPASEPTLVPTPAPTTVVAPAPIPVPAPPVADVPIPPPAPAPIPATVAAIPIPAPPEIIPPVPAPSPAPETVKPVEQAPAGDPEEQVRALWRKAIDAEINQDYVEAVACYEKIKKLPADVQPQGLDMHLSQARKMVK